MSHFFIVFLGMSKIPHTRRMEKYGVRMGNRHKRLDGT